MHPSTRATVSSTLRCLRSRPPSPTPSRSSRTTSSRPSRRCSATRGVDTGSLYLVDGNLKDWGTDVSVNLEGSKGTRAGAELPQDFLDQLNEVWTADGNDPIDAVTYSAEAYDAVILMALSALAAGSVEGADMAEQMGTVSGGGDKGEKCTTYAECADIINGGGTADYDGLSGEITFDENNDPKAPRSGVYEFGADNTNTRLK